MPDLIQNRLQVLQASDEQIAEIMDAISFGPGKSGRTLRFDFNKVRPIPGGLKDKSFRRGPLSNWLHFNWGPADNAIDSDDERNASGVIYFKTVYGIPVPIMQALSAMFPSVIFRLDYAGDHHEADYGSLLFEDGQITSWMKVTEYGDFAEQVAQILWNTSEISPIKHEKISTPAPAAPRKRFSLIRMVTTWYENKLKSIGY